MKRVIYYIAFTLLGVLVGFFVHAVIEMLVIKLLLSDFEKYNLGLSWTSWERIHDLGTIGLVLVLGWLGFRGGKKWWRILYIEKRFRKRWGINLKENF